MTTERRFIAYYRVSTHKQGHSGLGLEAQRAAVAAYVLSSTQPQHMVPPEKVAGLLAEYTEIESGKSDTNRPQLQAAMRHARLTGSTLLIAKLDRLSRDAHFLMGLEKAGVDFVAADMPNANRLTVRLMAVLAQEEREMISARTKAALAASKARGTVLGGYRGQGFKVGVQAAGRQAIQDRADLFAADVGPIILELRAAGVTLAKIATTLTDRGIRTASGKGAWAPTTVLNVLNRIA